MRTSPRISVTKLGEYTTANATRRRSIVKDQRDPKDFIVVRYDRVRGPLADFFVKGAADANPLTDLAQQLSTVSPVSAFDEQDLELSCDVLAKFLDISDAFDLDGLDASAGANDPQKISVSGVDVSVRPDVVLRGTYRGKRVVGALKFHFSKSNSLNDESGLNVATVLHQYVESVLAVPGEIASARHCAVLDVPTQSWYRAPTANRLRRNTIAAACQEIALWWAAP